MNQCSQCPQQLCEGTMTMAPPIEMDTSKSADMLVSPPPLPEPTDPPVNGPQEIETEEAPMPQAEEEPDTVWIPPQSQPGKTGIVQASMSVPVSRPTAPRRSNEGPFNPLPPDDVPQDVEEQPRSLIEGQRVSRRVIQ